MFGEASGLFWEAGDVGGWDGLKLEPMLRFPSDQVRFRLELVAIELVFSIVEDASAKL